MTAEQLTIQARAGREAGQRILDVTGRLDLSTSLAFLERVRVETAPVVILDMTNVDYVDSSGVGAIAQVHKSFELENRRLALAGLTPRVRLALEITHVLKMLKVFGTGSEAERALTGETPGAGQAN
jgi:anti-sigma B factor antagonist